MKGRAKTKKRQHVGLSNLKPLISIIFNSYNEKGEAKTFNKLDD